MSTTATRPEGRQVPEDLRMWADRVRGSETKPSLRSTEFWVYLASVVGVLAAAQLVGTNAQGVDPLGAERAWWFITLLTIGYLISRGLAKAGSQWRRTEEQP